MPRPPPTLAHARRAGFVLATLLGVAAPSPAAIAATDASTAPDPVATGNRATIDAETLNRRLDAALHQLRQLALDMNGGFEDREALQRYRVGAQFRLRPVALRASVFDDVPDRRWHWRAPAGGGVDGYDLEVGAQVPGLPWAWLRANRYWQIAAGGDETTSGDRLSLRLLPLAPLEIETGTQGGEQDRSWFAQLRVRFRLGDD